MAQKTSAKPPTGRAPEVAPCPPAQTEPPAVVRGDQRTLPPHAVSRAKEAFKNFSLSKFAGNARPTNYVGHTQTMMDTQRRVISHNLTRLQGASGTPRAMTIALPAAALSKLLPSYDANTGKVDLADVLKLLEQNMTGTEFVANGNPTLNRLAIQSQVQQIIDEVKRGAAV
jgi:hypothetical protein